MMSVEPLAHLPRVMPGLLGLCLKHSQLGGHGVAVLRRQLLKRGPQERSDGFPEIGQKRALRTRLLAGRILTLPVTEYSTEPKSLYHRSPSLRGYITHNRGLTRAAYGRMGRRLQKKLYT